MAYAIVSVMPGRRPEDKRLSDAFRDVYESAGVSQVQIADALEGVDQPAVSKWARGLRPPPLWSLPVVETLCGVAKGTILRQAGFIADELDLETAIMTAPADIDPVDRQALLLLYRTFAARRMSNGPVMPLPRTPGMTAAEEQLRQASEEQARQHRSEAG